jgi:hypothetical protein
MTKQELKKAKAILKKANSKDNSHIARIANKGWRPGSACYYIQQHLKDTPEKIAKAIMKAQGKNKQACFATLDKAVARVKTIQRQAKMLHIPKAR